MNSENYHSKEIGIKEISLEQYRRCAIEGSKNILNDPVQREVYVNAVKSMEIIMFPDVLNHDEIKVRLSLNEDKITRLENEYEHHIKRLRDNLADGRNINQTKLQHHYEKKLIELMQEKLIILGLLLKKLNYYSEGSVEIG